MDSYIARANIDHYLALLSKDGVLPPNRSVIAKLLIEEENKLSHDLEQLEFAESRLAACRDRSNGLKRLRDSFVEGSDDQVRADGLVLSFEGILRHMEDFCCHMRKRVQASKI